MTVELPQAVRLIDEKLAADAPIGYYQDKPITKGAGRFGPFVKWNDIYVSIPKRPNLSFDTINEAQAVVLIEEKNKKEAERYIQSWAEYNLAIENGRWGPFIRYGKVNFKLIEDGQKIPAEVAATLTLKQVVAIVAAQGTTILLTAPAPKAEKEASDKVTKPKRTKK
jgi:DNA topoisomerase-1